MSVETAAALRAEWLLLQRQHEQYEFAALAIKLAAVVLTALLAPRALLVALLPLLWLQDAIVKTFQARLGERLLQVEQALGAPALQVPPMQLHSHWLARRPRGVALLREYAASACRPTVAFPYPLLIALALLFPAWLTA